VCLRVQILNNKNLFMTTATIKENGDNNKILSKKYFSKFKKPLIPIPDLAKDQVESFKWLVEKGIKEVFDEFTAINDSSGKKFKFEFLSFELEKPKYDEYYAKKKKLSYEAPLKAKVRLTNKTTSTEKEQEIFMADFPMMTPHGTFIVSGVERVVVPQLARSFGVFFTKLEIKGKSLFGVKVIPARGAWIEIETDIDKAIYVRIDRKRKFPVTSLLRAFGAETDSEIFDLFKDNPQAKEFLEKSLAKDHAKTAEESYVEIYRRLRDGDLVTAENAREFFKNLFEADRYDLQKVGRFRFNSRFNLPTSGKDIERRILNLEDLRLVVNHIIQLNTTSGSVEDDIDHLGSRRVRYVGELMQQKFRIGMAQIKRNMQNRMSTVDVEMTLPIQFITTKPLQARLKEFFTTNQLSQFMAQENPLAEIEHLRMLSALGPGGLDRSRAGFEVRDVHPSHYGRLCPIHTPEGPNIGLILHLALYARINEFGMIETPYVKVKGGKVTEEVEYLNALEEEKFAIAHAAIEIDDKGNIVEEMVEVRLNSKPDLVPKSKVDYMDIATNQAFSIATSLIPFLNHNDANRALMGSNMQKQATPCVEPEAPLVATGIEGPAMRDTGRLIIASGDGVVSKVDGGLIETTDNKGKKISYKLVNFAKTNSSTCFHQRPAVNIGDRVKRGDVIADTLSSVQGEMALGQNILIAFLSWSGANYEDAIILSENLIKNNKFTTVHIDEVVVNVRETKLGPEVTTCDIPNVGENKLKNLAEDGVIRIGAEVNPGSCGLFLEKKPETSKTLPKEWRGARKAGL
jgi:DNA-directed RNA polymerase subunit beta